MGRDPGGGGGRGRTAGYGHAGAPAGPRSGAPGHPSCFPPSPPLPKPGSASVLSPGKRVRRRGPNPARHRPAGLAFSLPISHAAKPVPKRCQHPARPHPWAKRQERPSGDGHLQDGSANTPIPDGTSLPASAGSRSGDQTIPTLGEARGPPQRHAVNGAGVAAGVQGESPLHILDVAVLGCQPRALQDDVPRGRADGGPPCRQRGRLSVPSADRLPAMTPPAAGTHLPPGAGA